MATRNRSLREGVVAGSIASLLSTAYLVWAGHRRGEAAAPLNAVSHWIFGDSALRQDGAAPLFTGTGFLIHHLASIFWGVLHARAWAARPECKRPARAVAGAVVASGVACLVDYRLTPKRLTPGFEHRLSTREMVNVYALFALGLALGSMWMRKR